MEDTRKLNTVMETIAWAHSFLRGDHGDVHLSADGTGALGVGVILVGLIWSGYRKPSMNGFTGTMGILALVLGGMCWRNRCSTCRSSCRYSRSCCWFWARYCWARALLLNRNEA